MSSDTASKKVKFWHVPVSKKAKNTHNPIRKICDGLDMSKVNPNKEMIRLSLGDPCGYGNLFCPDTLVEALVKAARAKQNNGYIDSTGTKAARTAIAKYHSNANVQYADKDVIMGSGCSGTLEIAITGLLDEGTNMLVPQPGFPLYEVIADSHGASVKKYRLLAEKGWESDLEHMESLIDANTRCILINNPSNPCGSVFTKEHLQGILKIAERHHLPIIADEIYGRMTFEGFEMHPMAELSKTVPILTTSGLAKEFIVPGWRVGWLLIHDPVGAFDDLRKGLHNLSQIIIGANSIVQAAVPAVLDPVAGSKEEAELVAFISSTWAPCRATLHSLTRDWAR